MVPIEGSDPPAETEERYTVAIPVEDMETVRRNIITSEFGYRKDPFTGKTKGHSIEKVLKLSYREFSELKVIPLKDQPFIRENKSCMFSDGSVMHCLLALGEGYNDGILIQSCGYDYPRYAAYIPGMRDILNAELERAAARIVQDAAEHTRDGSWRVSFDTLKEQTGLNVQVGNGLDEMLLEKLAKREEVFSASLRSDRIERICTRCFTIVLV